jgi:hypothetical protein
MNRAIAGFCVAAALGYLGLAGLSGPSSLSPEEANRVFGGQCGGVNAAVVVCAAVTPVCTPGTLFGCTNNCISCAQVKASTGFGHGVDLLLLTPLTCAAQKTQPNCPFWSGPCTCGGAVANGAPCGNPYNSYTIARANGCVG